MATEERGEDELVLAGIIYLLRPSYTAIKAMERVTGQSLMALARASNLGNMSLEATGVVVAEMIKAGAKDELLQKISADRVAELCYEEGLPAVFPAVTICLASAANGGRTSTGERKAAVAPAA